MGAILLGSAGENPIIIEENNAIPIPDTIPADPTVLTELPSEQNTGSVAHGIPEGGSQGQVLAKKSDANYDVEWKNDETGGGSSVPEDTIIHRDINGLITSVEKVSKTVNITRNPDDSIASTNDGIYLKEIVRVGGMISEINVTVL